jgi:hypothetical protein
MIRCTLLLIATLMFGPSSTAVAGATDNQQAQLIR